MNDWPLLSRTGHPAREFTSAIRTRTSKASGSRVDEGLFNGEARHDRRSNPHEVSVALWVRLLVWMFAIVDCSTTADPAPIANSSQPVFVPAIGPRARMIGGGSIPGHLRRRCNPRASCPRPAHSNTVPQRFQCFFRSCDSRSRISSIVLSMKLGAFSVGPPPIRFSER